MKLKVSSKIANVLKQRGRSSSYFANNVLNLTFTIISEALRTTVLSEYLQSNPRFLFISRCPKKLHSQLLSPDSSYHLMTTYDNHSVKKIMLTLNSVNNFKAYTNIYTLTGQ
uniref:Uncharacterized protein n=1 Tax=Trichobilharzia regenti TaxID=157069 RepID=A0AA85K676_TRIRE|nr:unnamed protein product [Trichobilharzia regenti]